MPLIKYRTEKQEVNEIMVNNNITVSGFLDLVNSKSKEKVTRCIFRGKILDNDDLIRNYVTYPSHSLTLLTGSGDNIQSDIVDFDQEAQENANKKELENKISSMLIKRTQDNQNRKGYNYTFTIYTTATLESMIYGTKKNFSLTSPYYLIHDEIEDLVSSLLHIESVNDFELHIFLPGGVYFNSGAIIDYYTNPENIEYDYLYVLVIKTPKIANNINEQIAEPCSCSDDKRKEILSPFCQSSINGLTQISAFLGYLYYGGNESEHILLSLAKITRFAPLVVNIYRLIEKRPLNILNILAITSPLFTLFRSMLPQHIKDENVFEYTLNFLTIFKSIKNSEYLKFLEFDSRNKKDCGKMRRFYRYCKKTNQQSHVIVWTADTINPDFESFFIKPDFSTIENIFKTIKTFKPVSPLSLHNIFNPTFVRGNEDKSVILFLKEISNKENCVLVIDPKEGHQKEINIEKLADEMNCKEKEDFDALIEPNQVDQIIFICFDESRSQFASDFLKELVKQSYVLRVFSLYGLISFGSDVKTIQPLTAMTTQFTLNLNEISTQSSSGNEFLYDGIKKAQEQISSFCKGKEGEMKYPNSRSRIIVISSDDADNKSETSPETLINSLNSDEIVVDTISLSLNDKSSDCFTISRLTGGLCFNPHSIEEGIEIFEQEGFVNIKNRHMKALPYELITSQIFETENKKNEEQEGDKKYDKFAPNQLIINAKTKVSLCTPEYMIYIQSMFDSIQSYRKKRILIELNIISKKDNDDYFVYPLYATSEEWRIFIRGQKNSAFENKWLELYMTIPIKYPKKPPRFRFTGIPFHPNVSKEGLVFYGLNNDDYKSTIGIDSMIIGIIQILTNPDENYIMNAKAMKLFKENIDEFKRQQAEGFTGVENYEEYLSGVKIYNEIPKDIKLLKEEERNKTYIMSIRRDAFNDVALKRGEIKDQCLLDIKDYEIIDKIGEGGFSVIYLVNDIKNGFEFVAKVSNHLSSDNLIDYIKEVNVISLLNHAAIAKIYGYCLKDFYGKNNQVIIMEYVPNGTLQDIIDCESCDVKDEGWDRTQKLIALYGIASGMAYSVSYGITHSDLKPINILMTDEFFPKITDFDSARIAADSNRQSFNLSGNEICTALYTAPEVIEGSENYLKNAEKSDVYSFAIIAYQMITLITPFKYLSQNAFIEKIMKGKRPKIPNSVPKQYCDLITQCWSQKPSQRPTFQQIVDRLKSDEFLSDKEIDKERFQDYVDYVKDYKFTLTKSKFIRPVTEADKKKKKEEEDEAEMIKRHINVLILKMTDYTKETFLGKGRYGEVYKITQKETGNVFAAKISFQKVSSKISQDILSEVNIMKSLNHPSILKFIGYSPLDFEGDPMPTLIIEYSKNGSLQDLIDNKKKINDTQKLIIVFGIASGMSYLVEHSILHNDLKPSNVLLDEHLQPKISDFGLSQKIARAENQSNETISIRGTPSYIAPEIWDNNKHNEASEVYSFGILLYELAFMKKAFVGFKPLQISFKVQNGERPPIPFSLLNTNVYKSLIQRCWSQEPEKRPTFKEIIEELQGKKYITKNVNKEEFQRFIESIQIDEK